MTATPTPKPPRITPAGRWSDLARRAGSGIIMAIGGLTVLIVAGIWLRLAVVAILGLLIWELARLTAWRHAEYHAPRHPVLLGLMSAAVLLVMLFAPFDWAMLLVALPIAYGWTGTHVAQRPAFVAFTLLFFLSAFGLVVIRETAGLATALWIVGTVVLSDLLGYFVGRAVGGPKFWPAVSPKKTWSGTAAGWVGAAVLGVILVLAGRAGWAIVLLGPVIALAGQMGDIAESWLKRRVGVKDSSNLIPGHGGVMDRFDALAGALAVAALVTLVMPLPALGG